MNNMEELAELWTDACAHLWEVTQDRPYINRDELTMWDAFHYLYLKKTTDNDNRGRHSHLGGN